MIAASDSLAAVGLPGRIDIFGIPGGERRYGIDAGSVTALALSPTALATGGEDGRVRLWAPASGAERPFPAESIHSGPVTHLAFSHDGLLASAGGLRSEKLSWIRHGVRVWAASGLVRDFHSALGTPAGLAFSPDGRRLAIAEGDVVSVVEVASGDTVCRGSGFGRVMEQQSDFESRTAHVTCVAFAPDGRAARRGGK